MSTRYLQREFDLARVSIPFVSPDLDIFFVSEYDLGIITEI